MIGITTFSLFLMPLVTSPTVALAQPSSFKSSHTMVHSEKIATAPQCTQKILWYTKGTQICAPTTTRGIYSWQTSIKRSDTTAFMKTCRSFFSTAAGRMLCDWMQKYVDNVIAIKGPRNNCLTYWKNLLNNAARVAQTTKSATVGTAIEPFAAKNSWVCHP